MNDRLSLGIVSGLVLALGLSAAGCSRSPPDTPPPAPVSVTVSYPVERNVTDYAVFTARIATVDSVEVKAHVWGYLQKANFKEGALVRKGDVLFELDPRPYEAMLNQAKAKVAQDEAQLKFDEAEHARNVGLFSSRALPGTSTSQTSRRTRRRSRRASWTCTTRRSRRPSAGA
jgi:multidrug efflux pump subunit AcrA (membrane-fusion protein)